MSIGGPLSNSDLKVNYEMTLRRPVLRHGFPSGLCRRKVHRRIDQQRQLRNRIAHLETIIDRPLGSDFENILIVLGWLSPETRDWVKSLSEIPDLLAKRHEKDFVGF